MTDWLRTEVAGDRFRARLDLDALARLAPGSGHPIGSASGTRLAPDRECTPDVDLSPELVALINSAAPHCEVRINDALGKHRCPDLATYSIRTECVCHTVTIDLLCTEHYERLFNQLVYTCPACHARDRTISRAAARL